MVQNLSQKFATSAQDFCERYPIEKRLLLGSGVVDVGGAAGGYLM